MGNNTSTPSGSSWFGNALSGLTGLATTAAGVYAAVKGAKTGAQSTQVETAKNVATTTTNWAKIAMIVGGVVLAIFGVFIITRRRRG